MNEPYTLPFRPEGIPHELTTLIQFVPWKWEERAGKPTKPLLNGRQPWFDGKWYYGKNNDPETWTGYYHCLKHIENYSLPGLGFVFSERDPYCGIDLDKCRNRETGEIAPWALDIIRRFDTYSEVSPSGTGVKMLVRATLPGSGRKQSLPHGIEAYDRLRYFTLTGNRLDGSPKDIRQRQAEAVALWGSLAPIKPEKVAERPTETRPASVADEKIVAKVKASDKGGRLWAGDLSDYGGDHSTADMALAGIIAFYAGPDEDAIDRIFRLSGLMRDKWNRDDYRERTIARVIDDREEWYQWPCVSDEEFAAMVPATNQLESPVNAPGAPPSPPEPVKDERPVEPAPKRELQALTVSQLRTLPRPTWLIKNHLVSGGFAMVKGPSGVKKTFYALGMALSVATGEDFLGHPVKRGDVFYIAGEGASGLTTRIDAWKHRHRIEADPDNLHFFTMGLPIGDPTQEGLQMLDLLIRKTAKSPKLLVVDTLARNFGPGDENSTKDMGTFIRLLDAIRVKYDCTILLIHHTRYGDNKERGNTCLRGACDTIIDIQNANGGIVVACDKQKDSAPFMHYVCRAESIGLPYRNEDGSFANSLVLSLQGREDTEFQFLNVDEKETLRQIMIHRGITHGRICEEMGAAKSTVSKRVGKLIARGFVVGSEDGYNATERVSCQWWK